MAKIHLFIGVRSVAAGEDQTAICGATVPKAQPLPLDVAEGKSTIIFCKDCFGPKYTCAIVAGQESLNP